MTGCYMLDYGVVARQNGKRLPCESLAVENAELRELVRDMWTCIMTACKGEDPWKYCDQCELWNGCNNHRCEFDQRASELGVEDEYE